jgi:hypothetical protein
MVKRIAAVLAAAAMGATALTAVPAYADGADGYVPDPAIVSIDVNPMRVVVGRHGSVTVTATVKTKDVASATIEVVEPAGDDGHGGWHWSSKRDNDQPLTGPKWDTWSQSWTFDWSHKTGAWKVHVVATGVDSQVKTADRVFYVQHVQYSPRPKGPKATRIVGFDATPEPVKKGRKLALQGKLQVAQCYSDWYYGWDDSGYVRGGGDYCNDNRDYWNDWHWLGYQDIGLYFLPKGAHHWKYLATIQTNPDGSFYTQAKAFKSGTWGVRFNGNGRLGSSEAYDYVKVVRHY